MILSPEALAAAEAWARRLLARAVRPPERLSVAEWAARYRKVSGDSGSPHPGDWRNERTPHLVEPMECMGPDHPAVEIFIRKSAQTGFTEAAVNALCYYIDRDPCPILYLLPTLEAASKFNRTKLEPTILASRTLAQKVRMERETGRGASTATFKRFPGGYLIVGNAQASANLQMFSARVLICDEVSEYPEDSGGRGDPVKQAEARMLAYTRQKPKKIKFSTPALKGSCRIDAGWERSDKRVYHPPCPHCGWHQPLDRDRLRWDSDVAPHTPWFECAAHSCRIEFRHLDAMVQAKAPDEEGVGRLWLKTYVDADDPEGNPPPPAAIAPEEFARWRARPSKGRPVGFDFWQAMSRLADWEGIVAARLGADTPEKQRAYVQQVEGLAYEERGDAPPADKLLMARPPRHRGRIPEGYWILTGAVDVQGNRLEWAVYAWGPGMRSALVDWGVVEGDTSDAATWALLDEPRLRTYPDGYGRFWRPDVWMIDAGFRSEMTYWFCRQRGGMQGDPATIPIMGADLDSARAQVTPILSTPRPVAFSWEGRPVAGGVMRYDLNTWRLKAALYDGLRLTLQAASAPAEDGRLPERSVLFCVECDREFFDQLTAESLVTTKDRLGREKRAWKKDAARQRNEQMDLWNYCRAGAEWLELEAQDSAWWAGIAAHRGPAQGELLGAKAALDAEARAGAQAQDWAQAGNGWAL